MKGMGIGHEFWQGEGNERAWVWTMDIIKVDIKEYVEKPRFGSTQ